MKKDETEHNRKVMGIIKDIMNNKKEGMIVVSFIDGERVKTTSLVRGKLREHIIALDKHFVKRVEGSKPEGETKDGND